MNRYQHARGHYLWFEWNSQAVPGVRAIYAVARDVTERVTRAEAHRREEQSRLHLAAVVDSAALAIYSTTPDGIVQSWNRGAESLYGYRAEEIVGRSILLIFTPGREGEGEGAEILSRVKHGEVVQHSESVRFRKDGTAIHISLTISPVRDEAGHIIGASRIAYDITDRKNMEAALRDREARLRAVVDTAIEAIVTIDAAGTIESLNRSGEAMFGYSPGVTASNARTYRQQLVKALETKTPQGLKRQVLRDPKSATIYD